MGLGVCAAEPEASCVRSIWPFVSVNRLGVGAGVGESGRGKIRGKVSHELVRTVLDHPMLKVGATELFFCTKFVPDRAPTLR
ncbi:hypothetical protein GCM10010471_26450 [Leucobacter komagatae]